LAGAPVASPADRSPSERLGPRRLAQLVSLGPLAAAPVASPAGRSPSEQLGPRRFAQLVSLGPLAGAPVASPAGRSPSERLGPRQSAQLLSPGRERAPRRQELAPQARRRHPSTTLPAQLPSPPTWASPLRPGQ
jgi:hypothetical protein